MGQSKQGTYHPLQDLAPPPPFYTVEPRYNEVPGDRTIYFVITGVCYKQSPDITKLLKKYENLTPGLFTRCSVTCRLHS